ncbi:zinc finger MYM-type protein 1-like [Trichonephila clavata]|uniref:Zinc finger MYM-type protein 1-like n=1 Tax=Trichonephila clavata TaxID=2740835 RepID=A0A8X6LQ79_TRICU|nr:zinc finger MYM-type protein 1-like [Trichonephila clavata]
MTQDISKVDQISFVLKYAVRTISENGLPVDIEVKEVFLGFYADIKQGATELVNQVAALFIDKNIDLKQCLGQDYDGASVCNGVQKPIKAINSSTFETNGSIACGKIGKRSLTSPQGENTYDQLLLDRFDFSLELDSRSQQQMEGFLGQLCKGDTIFNKTGLTASLFSKRQSVRSSNKRH